MYIQARHAGGDVAFVKKDQLFRRATNQNPSTPTISVLPGAASITNTQSLGVRIAVSGATAATRFIGGPFMGQL